MLEAIQNIHEINKVHLNIKPKNFRITDDYRVKLLNFGAIMDYNFDGKHKPFGVYNL